VLYYAKLAIAILGSCYTVAKISGWLPESCYMVSSVFRIGDRVVMQLLGSSEWLPESCYMVI